MRKPGAFLERRKTVRAIEDSKSTHFYTVMKLFHALQNKRDASEFVARAHATLNVASMHQDAEQRCQLHQRMSRTFPSSQQSLYYTSNLSL